MLKMFKNGFAAIIALLAITATIAAQAGVFENTKLAVAPSGCYEPQNLESQPTLPDPEEGQVPLPSPICTTVTGTAVDPNDCFFDENVCCYVVEAQGTSPCSPTQNRVVAVVFGTLIQ